MKQLQAEHLHKSFDDLQQIYGDLSLNSIYGAGCTDNPDVMFVFMNPTARNIAASKNWSGIKAPWLGIKNIWNMFYKLGLINRNFLNAILQKHDWCEDFALELYNHVSDNRLYITNLAKCTQIDARQLDNSIFGQYITLLRDEISFVKPKTIVSFGAQVSSIMLGENIKISADNSDKSIEIQNKKFRVIPAHYPVGHGQRNMNKSIETIERILAK